MPPLCSEVGTESDHAVLVNDVSALQIHSFEWIKFKVRDVTPCSKKAFARDFSLINWEEEIGQLQDPSAMTERLHSVIDSLNNHHFPLKEIKYKSTDKPWITKQVKRKIRRRKRAYDKNGDRSERWKRLKAESNAVIARNKKKHYAKAAAKLKRPGAGQIPYRNT